MSKKVGKMWMCPICGRNFSRNNQVHSCELYSIEDHHLKKTLPATAQAYYQFIKSFQNFGPYTLEPLKNIIAIKKISQFCTIQVQKSALKIIFRCFSHFSSPRFSTQHHQDKLWYYQLKIKNQGEIDAELIDWLKHAYMEN